jgi:hypothetical protein
MSNTTKIALDKILNANVNEITKTFIEDMFASYHDKETNTFKQSNFLPNDKIELTSKEYKWVDGKITTTLGMLVFNRYILERLELIEFIHYWNKPLNDKGLAALNTAVNNLVIVDKITTKKLGEYIDSRDRLGFWCSAFLAPSISEALLRPMNNVNKRKAELFKENTNVLNSDNSVDQIMTVNKIEKELIGMVRENLKDDPGYDMYASGVNDLDNNYKTINVMRGAVWNGTTQKYDIVENSLLTGITKKDITAFANSVVAGAYPSAVGTAEAGYMAKKLLALLQSEHIDPNPNSDCGTTVTIPFTVTNKNKQYVLYRYVNMNGKKVLTTLENIDSFVGKTVQLYTPQGCKQDAICGKCAGKVFHNLGVTQIGMLTTPITQKILNLKLKSKHDLSQSAGIIPEEYLFLDKNKYCYIDSGENNGMLKNKVTMKLFIPRLLEELKGFVREPTKVDCMGIFPVKFYDNNDKEIFSTMLTIPAVISFNIYSDIQEDENNYIITYTPESNIGRVVIQKSIVNIIYFMNQIYLDSRTPQIPYNLMTEMMFRCLEINGIDLTGPSITYELLARRTCTLNGKTFAKAYATNKTIDQMSYTKLAVREAVQDAGVLQAVLFQDTSKSMVKGLAATLNGVEPTPTPLEKIIKS